MAGTPRFKVFSPDGEYVASAKTPEVAAMVVGGLDGGVIRDSSTNGPIVWTDGRDGFAGDSYNYVAEVVWQRIREAANKRFAQYRDAGTISEAEYQRFTSS